MTTQHRTAINTKSIPAETLHQPLANLSESASELAYLVAKHVPADFTADVHQSWLYRSNMRAALHRINKAFDAFEAKFVQRHTGQLR